MRLKYEPSSEPLHISAKADLARLGARVMAASALLFFFTELSLLCFFTLVTGPRRSLSLKLSDTRVYAPQIPGAVGREGDGGQCPL